jgi:tRNA(fMet)-specific endonuclease VapC
LVLTAVLLGGATYAARAAAVPLHEQAVPVIVIEAIMRGRFNIIRQAEGGRVSISLARADELLEDTFTDFQRLHILSYTPQVESPDQEWRQQGIRLATHDLQVAAIGVGHAAILISRNRRDFEPVPGLVTEFWEWSPSPRAAPSSAPLQF